MSRIHSKRQARLRLVAALTVTMIIGGLVATGCGNDEGRQVKPGNPEFTKAVEAACADFKVEARAAAEGDSTLAADGVRAARTDLVDRLSNLEPPSQLRRDTRALIDALRSANAISSTDSEGATRAAARINRSVRELGVGKCTVHTKVVAGVFLDHQAVPRETKSPTGSPGD